MSAGDDYDAMAEIYRDHVSKELDHHSAFRDVLDSFADQVAGGLVADIGCGPGHIAKSLRTRGSHVIGIDLSARLAAFAHQSGLPVARGDVGVLPLPDDSVDAVLVRSVLIHVEPTRLEQACRELMRVLKPGGDGLVSFFVTDSEGDAPVFHDHVVSPSWRYASQHLGGYLSAAGATIQSVTPVSLPDARAPSVALLVRKS